MRARGPSSWFMVLTAALVLVGGIVVVVLDLEGGGRRWTDDRRIDVPAGGVDPRDVLWEPPLPVEGAVETPDAEYAPHVSPDGLELYLVRGRAAGGMRTRGAAPGDAASGGADILLSRRTAAGWSVPEAIEAINSAADDLHPVLSPDGAWLYFSSDRAGGAGGYDLWRSPRTPEGWGTPEALGRRVNTGHDELSPAWTPDGTSLWFASNRPAPGDAGEATRGDWGGTMRAPRGGRRDFDLYRAASGDAGLAAARRVEALSGPHDDGTPAISPAGDHVYFASDRPGGRGGFDLLRARLIDGEPGKAVPLDGVNSAADELDPALDLEGFGLVFASDRQRLARPGVAGEAGGDGEREGDTPMQLDIVGGGDERLLRSISREVRSRQDEVVARFDGRALLPAVPWLLALLLLALLAWLLRSLHVSGRLATIGLLARCLIASALAHAVLALLLGAWTVSGALADGYQDRGGGRAQLSSAAIGGALERQLFGSPSEPMTVDGDRAARAMTVQETLAALPAPSLDAVTAPDAPMPTDARAMAEQMRPAEMAPAPGAEPSTLAAAAAAIPALATAEMAMPMASPVPAPLAPVPAASPRRAAVEPAATDARAASSTDAPAPSDAAVPAAARPVTVPTSATPSLLAAAAAPSSAARPNAPAVRAPDRPTAAPTSAAATPPPSDTAAAAVPPAAPDAAANAAAGTAPAPSAPRAARADPSAVLIVDASPAQAEAVASPAVPSPSPGLGPQNDPAVEAAAIDRSLRELLAPPRADTAAASPSVMADASRVDRRAAPDLPRAAGDLARADVPIPGVMRSDVDDRDEPVERAAAIATALASPAPVPVAINSAVRPLAAAPLRPTSREVLAAAAPVVQPRAIDPATDVALSDVMMNAGRPDEAAMNFDAPAAAPAALDLPAPPVTAAKALPADSAIDSDADADADAVLRALDVTPDPLLAAVRRPAPRVDIDPATRPDLPGPAAAPVARPRESDRARADDLSSADRFAATVPDTANLLDAAVIADAAPAWDAAPLPMPALAAAPAPAPAPTPTPETSPREPALPAAVAATPTEAEEAAIVAAITAAAEKAGLTRVILGRVTDVDTERPLGGAEVRLDQREGEAIVAVVDDAGWYLLLAPDGPESIAITATRPGHLPASANVTADDRRGAVVRRDLALAADAGRVIALESDPEVHHLGDDEFSGAVNSRFQRASEGPAIDLAFTLDEAWLATARARGTVVLSVLVRGAQRDNPVRINGRRIRPGLAGSPRDGRFGPVRLQFPADRLVLGRNVLRIESAPSGIGGDIDDFEFVNVQLEPAGPEERPRLRRRRGIGV